MPGNNLSTKITVKSVNTNPAPLSYAERLRRIRSIKSAPFRSRTRFTSAQKTWITKQYNALSSQIRRKKKQKQKSSRKKLKQIYPVVPYDYEGFLEQREIIRELRTVDERIVQEALNRLLELPPHLRDIEGAREQQEILRELHAQQNVEAYRETYDYKDARYYVFNWFDYDEIYSHIVDIYRAKSNTPLRIMFFLEDRRGVIESRSTSWNYNLRFDGPDDTMRQLFDEIRRWDSSPGYGRVLWDYEFRLVWVRS